VVLPAGKRPVPALLNRLIHEFGLKDDLEATWARLNSGAIKARTMLVLEDPGGEPLGGLLGAPMETGSFLRLGVSITAAIGKVNRPRPSPAHLPTARAD